MNSVDDDRSNIGFNYVNQSNYGLNEHVNGVVKGFDEVDFTLNYFVLQGFNYVSNGVNDADQVVFLVYDLLNINLNKVDKNIGEKGIWFQVNDFVEVFNGNTNRLGVVNLNTTINGFIVNNVVYLVAANVIVNWVHFYV